MKTRTKVFLGGLVLALLVGAGAIAAHYRNQYLAAQQKANDADNALVAAKLEAEGFQEAIREKGELNDLLNGELSESEGLRRRALQDLADTAATLRQTQSQLGIVKGENLSLEETIANMTQGGGTSEGEGTIMNPCGEGSTLDVRIEAGCQFSLVETNQERVFGKLFQEVTLFDKETDEIIMGPVELDPTNLTINLFENENVEVPERPRLRNTVYFNLGIDGRSNGINPTASLGYERDFFRPKLLFKERLAFKLFGQLDLSTENLTETIETFDFQTESTITDTFTSDSLDLGVRAGIRITFDF